MDIYKPREDSILILKEIKPYAIGNVLDIGTGTGILALEASRTADHVYAVDINKDALEFAKKQTMDRTNVNCIYSDLFSYFKQHPEKFDLIIFNPPYLPVDIREPISSRSATTGGKKGYEIIERFMKDASEFLMPYGRILIVFSTLTGKEHVHKIIEKYGFNYQKLSEEELFGETLFVYLIEKQDLIRELEKRKITKIQRIAKGHRGIVYTGILDNQKIAVKQQRRDTEAIGRIENEARWLKVLNRKNIGPEFLISKDDWFMYKFVEGKFIPDWLKENNKTNIKKVFADVFNQCFILDQKGINKEEMHKPVKHIIIKNLKPVLIDFERTHTNDKPKNVTQFCQFVSSKKTLSVLKEKTFKYTKAQITSAAKRYKKNMTKENLDNILKIIK